jgi:hypothetical protein
MGQGDVCLLLPSPRRKALFDDRLQFSPDRSSVKQLFEKLAFEKLATKAASRAKAKNAKLDP